MCAPGILFNSLKSGIAVDYPVYAANPAYHCPLTYFSGTITDAIKNPDEAPLGAAFSDERFSLLVTNSFSYGAFQMMGASRCIPSILNRPPNYRLPFEALYNLDRLDIFGKFPMFLTSDFVDLDYSTPSSLATASSVVGAQSPHHPGAAFIPQTPSALILPPQEFKGKIKLIASYMRLQLTIFFLKR